MRELRGNRLSLPASIFIIFFFSNVAVCLLFAFLSGGQTWGNIMFFNKNDFFMDFLNSMRDASGKDVFDKRVIYPPLANILFFIAARLVPEEMASSGWTRRYSMHNDQRSVLLYVLFATLCIVALMKIFSSYLASRTDKRTAVAFSVIVLLSYPLMYCVERGNITLLAFVATVFFVFFRNSENKIVRELSFLALAFAAGIKVYPAVFGLLLISDKKYKEAARLAVYGVLFFFVPFFFYDGFDSIKRMLANITRFSNNKASAFTLGKVSIENLCIYLGIRNSTIRKLVFILSEIIALLMFWVLPKQWQKCFALTFVTQNINSTSSYYSLIFLFIPIVLFISETQKMRKIDGLYLSCFILLVTPLPAWWHYFGTSFVKKIFDFLDINYCEYTNHLVAMPVFFLLFSAMFVESITTLWRDDTAEKKEKKSAH